MSKHVYNASILAGVALVSVGAGMVYLPAGLSVAGVLVLSLTILAARLVG